MTFNSLSYCFFLPLTYLVFRLTPHTFRWLVLLLASYGFYATFKAPQLLIALGTVTAISYRCGIRLAKTSDNDERRKVFWSGTAACLGILILVKYFLPALLSPRIASADASLLSTIGISFFTIQAVSYLADIYLESSEPERHPGYLALYLAFFPKILQGPVERAAELLPQLKKPYRFEYDNVRSGAVLFMWGLFKKIVIADRLAEFVDTAYGDVHSATPLVLIVATYFFAIQLYCDFSGYTDMALGTARVFNIHLSKNFDNPYLATSIADFWRRWHISFSRWLFDYIFKPLQMQWRNKRLLGTMAALFVTFLASGIWHGVAWGYVAWGMLHGVYLASSICYKPYQRKLYRLFRLENRPLQRFCQRAATFHLVCFAWIFFRANNIGDAFTLISKIPDLSLQEINGKYLRDTIGGLGMSQADMGIILISLIFITFVSVSKLNCDNFNSLFKRNIMFRWLFYITLSFIVIVLPRMKYVPFMYSTF